MHQKQPGKMGKGPTTEDVPGSSLQFSDFTSQEEGELCHPYTPNPAAVRCKACISPQHVHCCLTWAKSVVSSAVRKFCENMRSVLRRSQMGA